MNCTTGHPPSAEQKSAFSTSADVGELPRQGRQILQFQQLGSKASAWEPEGRREGGWGITMP